MIGLEEAPELCSPLLALVVGHAPARFGVDRPGIELRRECRAAGSALAAHPVEAPDGLDFLIGQRSRSHCPRVPSRCS
jgi:hypothetical protein